MLYTTGNLFALRCTQVTDDMKKIIFAISLIIFNIQPLYAVEIYIPDEIHGKLGLINNTADNYSGALLILDDRTKSVHLLLRSSEMVGPLYVIDASGIKRPNPDAFRTKKITSNTFAIKIGGGPNSPRLYANGAVFTNQPGRLTFRNEGRNTYSEIILYSDPKNFNAIWDLYVNSNRIVLEVYIDNIPVQLIFTR